MFDDIAHRRRHILPPDSISCQSQNKSIVANRIALLAAVPARHFSRAYMGEASLVLSSSSARNHPADHGYQVRYKMRHGERKAEFL